MMLMSAFNHDTLKAASESHRVSSEFRNHATFQLLAGASYGELSVEVEGV